MGKHTRWDRPTEQDALKNVCPPVLNEIVDAPQNSADNWSFFDEDMHEGFQIIYAGAAATASEGEDNYVPSRSAVQRSYNQTAKLMNRLLGESIPLVNRRGQVYQAKGARQ